MRVHVECWLPWMESSGDGVRSSLRRHSGQPNDCLTNRCFVMFFWRARNKSIELANQIAHGTYFRSVFLHWIWWFAANGLRWPTQIWWTHDSSVRWWKGCPKLPQCMVNGESHKNHWPLPRCWRISSEKTRQIINRIYAESEEQNSTYISYISRPQIKAAENFLHSPVSSRLLNNSHHWIRVLGKIATTHGPSDGL